MVFRIQVLSDCLFDVRQTFKKKKNGSGWNSVNWEGKRSFVKEKNMQNCI